MSGEQWALLSPDPKIQAGSTMRNNFLRHVRKLTEVVNERGASVGAGSVSKDGFSFEIRRRRSLSQPRVGAQRQPWEHELILFSTLKGFAARRPHSGFNKFLGSPLMPVCLLSSKQAQDSRKYIDFGPMWDEVGDLKLEWPRRERYRRYSVCRYGYNV